MPRPKDDDLLEDDDLATASDEQEQETDVGGSLATGAPEAGAEDEDAADEDGAEGSEAREEDPEVKVEKARKRRAQRARAKAQRQLEQTNAVLAEVRAELDELRHGHRQTQVQTALGRVQGDLQAAERQWREAEESGDADLKLKAQRLLLKAERDREQLEQFAQQQPPAQRPQPAAAQQAPQVAEAALEWAQRNSAWFNKPGQERRSHLARVIAEDLMAEDYYDPEDPDYYAELDTRLAAATGRPARRQEPPIGNRAAAPVQPRTNPAAAAVLGGSRRSPAGGNPASKGLKEPPPAEWKEMLRNAQASGHIDTTDNAQREALKREYWAVQARIGR